MSDQALRELAIKAGVAPEWRDQTGVVRAVAPETLRDILRALGLACEKPQEVGASLARLGAGAEYAEVPPLLATRVGERLALPASMGHLRRARAMLEDRPQRDITLEEGPNGGAILPGIEAPGYHRIEAGDREVVVAVAPPRCLTVDEVAGGERIWGLAAQIYGLRRAGDAGIGDMGGVAALAAAAGARGADALMLSPTHALFSADPGRFSPYSPSSRLFSNPLHADPALVFGAERVRVAVEKANLREDMHRLENLDLIDWPLAARAKSQLFRALFESFERNDLGVLPQTELAVDYVRFRAEGGEMLMQHACFEALHAERLGVDRTAWNWHSWPQALRDPASSHVAAFAATHQHEVQFHVFLQWLADRSLKLAQSAAKRAGMRVGLLCDLAVGMDSGGSHAWSRQGDILMGLSVGAPPDYYNADGQNWGLTTFSPRALVAGGFAPFIATLRAVLRHAGGLRIDHVMGLTRLWLIPEGAKATQGAYVSYPAESLFRLIALESLRHHAIIIGEDLGTLPHGFRERLDEEGIAGTQVLRFERDEHGCFYEPAHWRSSAVAMSTTHDLPPTAGWWAGRDIEERARLNGFANDGEAAAERESRAHGRHHLWTALRHADVASASEPPPESSGPVVDACARFVAATPCGLAMLPLEDVLGRLEQPNLPGTIDEHPNWRIRLQGAADHLLEAPQARQRLEALNARTRRGRAARLTGLSKRFESS